MSQMIDNTTAPHCVTLTRKHEKNTILYAQIFPLVYENILIALC